MITILITLILGLFLGVKVNQFYLLGVIIKKMYPNREYGSLSKEEIQTAVKELEKLYV